MSENIIPNVVVSMPSQLFTLARKFQAASNGKIYIGEIDTDPTIPSNQIQVYLENEDGSTIPVSQPLIINQAGYPVYGGQIAKFVTVKSHSMAIYDAYNVRQHYFSNVLKYDTDQFSIWAKNNFLFPHYEKIQHVSFKTGATIEKENQVLLYENDGFYYQYVGRRSFPVQIESNSVPLPSTDWKCVGNASYPTTVESYNADPDGIKDSSKAFQLMLDNVGGLVLKYKAKYVIDKPIIFNGEQIIIEGNQATLIKKTNTRSGLPLIETYQGYADGDINCFIIGWGRVSYLDISNINFDARQASISDRPVAMYFTQVTNYSVRNVNTRGCRHSWWIKNSFIGNLSNFRGNESTSHDIFYDSSRMDANGDSTSPAQSATSVTMNGVYANAPSGDGFRLERVDYSHLILTASDHPKGRPYYFDTCKGVNGTLGAESFNTEMIVANDSTLNLTINTYIDGSPIDKYIFDFSNVIASIDGFLRLTHTKLINAKNKTYCTTRVGYWNGATARLPSSASDHSSSVRSFLLERSTEQEYDEIESKYGVRVLKGSTPFMGNTIPPRLGAYMNSVFKSGFNENTNLFLIPMSYIKSVLPSLNADYSSTFTITIDSTSGYNHGATFRSRNGTIISDLLTQKTIRDPNSEIVAITLYDIYLSIRTKGNISEAIISIKEV